ncbi:hypothetical protein Taro_033176 [Colocasia esculenta]|uniref:Uncharacterized protein n=1 Tax=Colocasia esculenta TaxID=4460 RepID=A0A843VN61_COLES|nr:hypothetical protein [Colocasia esculenta]
MVLHKKKHKTKPDKKSLLLPLPFYISPVRPPPPTPPQHKDSHHRQEPQEAPPSSSSSLPHRPLSSLLSSPAWDGRLAGASGRHYLGRKTERSLRWRRISGFVADGSSRLLLAEGWCAALFQAPSGLTSTAAAID